MNFNIYCWKLVIQCFWQWWPKLVSELVPFNRQSGQAFKYMSPFQKDLILGMKDKWIIHVNKWRSVIMQNPFQEVTGGQPTDSRPSQYRVFVNHLGTLVRELAYDLHHPSVTTAQCWLDAETTSPTLAQLRASIGPAFPSGPADDRLAIN